MGLLGRVHTSESFDYDFREVELTQTGRTTNIQDLSNRGKDTSGMPLRRRQSEPLLAHCVSVYCGASRSYVPRLAGTIALGNWHTIYTRVAPKSTNGVTGPCLLPRYSSGTIHHDVVGPTGPFHSAYFRPSKRIRQLGPATAKKNGHGKPSGRHRGGWTTKMNLGRPAAARLPEGLPCPFFFAAPVPSWRMNFEGPYYPERYGTVDPTTS